MLSCYIFNTFFYLAVYDSWQMTVSSHNLNNKFNQEYIKMKWKWKYHQSIIITIIKHPALWTNLYLHNLSEIWSKQSSNMVQLTCHSLTRSSLHLLCCFIAAKVQNNHVVTTLWLCGTTSQHCSTADSSKSADAFLSAGKHALTDIRLDQWAVRVDPNSQSVIRGGGAYDSAALK